MNKRLSGFTLLEVLLALLIISVALVAMVEAAGFAHKQTVELDQRQQAYRVADQVLMQLYQRTTVDDEQGSQQQKDQTYYWSVDVQSTDNPRILRLDVRVGLDRNLEYALAQLTGFKSNG
ncbi:type II secretion system minor pseudopilin GspI [Marinicella gelatinilytica]|uniref:type II secretion system minor pseudopilin GspI n=1 Tax=Marinicella gelatinilytica TaxID=2996017 RepID=UPI002260B601|nr:type II secretion system minor pseudopilin GspI [Marinicella gelatinilytica]MCX7544267.1 type II secretion system minor pseudopilin GspI [Marinicella gelatinilytica]